MQNMKRTLSRYLRNEIDAINRDLNKLDNGGYVIEYNRAEVVQLSKSDVRIAKFYKDKMDGNKIKRCNNEDIVAITQCFQEAAKQLENENNENINIR